ncbi:MAG TPA: tetratricopeptide repeat protein, partial [Tepidisphaeraceae bacterium]|nr:tetratricopeptide repeat protein [Tepidisphaeraceae bacterium]
RRELGEMLAGQGKPDEALAIMRAQPSQTAPVPGLEGVQLQTTLASLELSILRIRLDRMQSIPEAERTAEVEQIEQALKGATEKYALRPDAFNLLRLRGQIELERGQTAAALSTLNRAYGQAVAQNAPAEQRLQLMMLLANANLRLNQTGQAKDLLEGITREVSEFLPARELLASLHLMENNAPAAKPHVEFLLQRAPDDVRYQRLAMQLGMLDRAGLEARYAQMSEGTRDERMAKLRLAAAARKLDEIIRITRMMLAADKKDREATLLLASALFESEQRIEALAVLRAGLEADPTMSDAADLLARLEAEIAGNVEDLEWERAQKLADPFQRNLRLFELSVARGKIEEGIAYLKEAEKHDRNHRAAELLFSHYGSTRDWANAQVYLDKLAAANADQAGGRLFRARMLAARGEVQQAIDLARSVTTSLPDLANAWLTLAQCQQLAGLYNEAAADYVRAIDRAPTNTDALRGVIESLYAANRFEESRQYIELGRRLQPENTFFRQIELAWELSYGDPARIVDSRKQIVNDRPEVPENWLSLGVAYAGAIRKSQVDGQTAQADRYLRLATETFRDAMQQFPDDPRFVNYYADLSRQGKNLNAGVQAIQAFARLPSQQGKPDAVLMLADLYARAEQPAQAIPAMRQFLTDNPGVHPAVRVRLAKLLAGSRQVDEAVAILEAGAGDDDVRREQIELLINVNRFDEARRLIDDALKEEQTTLLYNLAALIELRSNNPQAAGVMLDKSFAIDPNDPAALYYRALIRASTPDGDLAGAIADLIKVRDRLPNNLEARLLLGEILYRRGDAPQAIREFEAIRERYPAERRAVLRLAELYINSAPPRWQQAERVVRETRELPGLIDDPELLNAEAIVLLNQGKARAAEPLINQAPQKSPNSLAITQTQIDVLLALDRHEQVLQAVDNALKRAPDLFWLYSARARAQLALRRTADATASYTRAIELALESGGNQLAQPVVLQMAERLGADVAARALGDRMSDPGWKIVLTPLFDMQGQRDRALQLADELLADRAALRRVQLEAALRTAAQTYHSAREYAKAYQAYKDLLELRPDDFGALNNLAYLLVTDGAPGGGPTEALTYITRAQDIIRNAGQSNPMISDTYGWVLILNGRVDEGIAVLEKVVEEAELPDAFYHLGSGYFRKEMYPQAIAVLERGKELHLRRPQNTPDAQELAGRFDDLLSRARVMGGVDAGAPNGNN